jgi:hypothetical protein
MQIISFLFSVLLLQLFYLHAVAAPQELHQWVPVSSFQHTKAFFVDPTSRLPQEYQPGTMAITKLWQRGRESCGFLTTIEGSSPNSYRCMRDVGWPKGTSFDDTLDRTSIAAISPIYSNPEEDVYRSSSIIFFNSDRADSGLNPFSVQMSFYVLTAQLHNGLQVAQILERKLSGTWIPDRYHYLLGQFQKKVGQNRSEMRPFLFKVLNYWVPWDDSNFLEGIHFPFKPNWISMDENWLYGQAFARAATLKRARADAPWSGLTYLDTPQSSNVYQSEVKAVSEDETVILGHAIDSKLTFSGTYPGNHWSQSSEPLYLDVYSDRNELIPVDQQRLYSSIYASLWTLGKEGRRYRVQDILLEGYEKLYRYYKHLSQSSMIDGMNFFVPQRRGNPQGDVSTAMAIKLRKSMVHRQKIEYLQRTLHALQTLHLMSVEQIDPTHQFILCKAFDATSGQIGYFKIRITFSLSSQKNSWNLLKRFGTSDQ